MTTTVKHRLRILRSLRRHPWRVASCILVMVVAAGIGGYALVFYHHLSVAEDATGRYDFDTAQEHLATCIRLWPHRSDLHLLAARTARRGGRLTDAEKHLSDYERLEGKTPEYVLEIAMIRVQKGDLREPGLYLLRLLEDDPPEATLILEALAYGTYHVYWLGAARHYTEEALEREPGNVPMMLLLAGIYDSRGQVDKAEGAYRATLDAQPDRDQARLGLAQILLRRRKIEEAADQFEQLRQRRYATRPVLMGLALCCQQRGGRSGEERELLNTLLSESPDNVQALAERARLELEADELDAAERDLRRATARGPFDRQANFFLAQCLDRRGKDEESAVVKSKLTRYEADMKRLQNLREEIGKKPNDPEKHRQAGLICQRYGLDREAERWFLGALQIDQQGPR